MAGDVTHFKRGSAEEFAKLLGRALTAAGLKRHSALAALFELLPWFEFEDLDLLWSRIRPTHRRQEDVKEHSSQARWAPLIKMVMADRKPRSRAEVETFIVGNFGKRSCIEFCYLYVLAVYYDEEFNRLAGSKIGWTGNPTDRWPKVAMDFRKVGFYVDSRPKLLRRLKTTEFNVKNIEKACHNKCHQLGAELLIGEETFNVTVETAISVVVEQSVVLGKCDQQDIVRLVPLKIKSNLNGLSQQQKGWLSSL